MPNFGEWVISYGGTSATEFYTATAPYYAQQRREEHLEEKRKEAVKRKQEAEDRRKYPLFFLKGGIV